MILRDELGEYELETCQHCCGTGRSDDFMGPPYCVHCDRGEVKVYCPDPDDWQGEEPA